MAKFPEPPAPDRLARIPPERIVLEQDTLLWRVYFRGGPFPGVWNALRDFGPTTARLDHHLMDTEGKSHRQTRRILYAALDGVTCLAEVFQRTRLIDRHARDPWLVGFAQACPLELLDLGGVWPTRAGASMALNTGPRAWARRWSQAIHAAYPGRHGLCYPSSMHANRPAMALYERAEAAGALPIRPMFHRALADPALFTLLRNTAIDLGYRLA